MLINQTFEIDSCDDVELNIKRTSKLETDKALFRKELPLMLEKLQGRKSFMQENSISYPCGNKVFTFKDVENQLKLIIN
ncbi:hypothetical protein BJH56_07235 [Campylobacter jejuni subsp. jejuni]|uniref:DUF2920 family protein n=1 Tax=Campylobacter jejuni TaxID=197 RepID=UPI000A22FCE2|nr:hypothetical protein BJH56_07235 [Campylobacter jejuni subsp. jejuni]